MNPTINATWQMYRSAALQATYRLAKNWMIPLASILAYLVFLFCGLLLSPLGMAGRFVLGLIFVALLTLYYGWLTEARRPAAIKARELLSFDYGLFGSLISVGFLLWIVDYLIRPLAFDSTNIWVFYLIQLGIFILLNAVAETIYIQRLESVVAIRYSISFVTTNWPEWFIPQLIILAPLFLINPTIVLTTWAQAEPLLPVSVLVNQLALILALYMPGVGGMIGGILAVVLATWFMFFRADLFSDLESGSRRMRSYQAKGK